jgi:protein SCO1/2
MCTIRQTAAIIVMLAIVAGCSRSRGRDYELRGQVLAVDSTRQEITIKHEDIAGFMPAMTMPFKVKDRKLLEGTAPGDLVRATLVVEANNAYLSKIDRTGRAPLTDTPPSHPAMETLNRGDAVPEAALVDQDGKPRRLSEWRGRVLGVTFTYTRCPLPNFCPLMDRNFAEVQRTIAADPALRDKVRLMTVSFDPDFDRPPVLSAHARRAGADPALWTFVTGDHANIDRLTERFGVSVFHEGDAPGDVVHNLRTAVVDAEGRLVEVFNGNDWKPADLSAALRTAAGVR